ncbi:hypothetical protein [Marinitenerispora sediminis]|uniref:hypothetical protein n=1 Tax=Marinitenerispora sediminis TaxID=1931232 RepID=UPI001F285F5F|nr:hypothetical protein [Marinitenerispora sediminis]
MSAAAATALALGTAGCTIDLRDWRPGAEPEPTPSAAPVDAAPIVAAALDALAEAPAVQVEGQLADANGQPRPTTLTVTNSGATSGTIQVDDSEVRVIAVDDHLFVSSDDSYWLSQSVYNPDTDSYADNWVRVTPTLLGVDPGAVLAPADLAEILRGIAPAEGEAEAVEEDLDGTPAYRINLEGGKIWISVEEPYRLLRMQIESLAPAEDAQVTTRAALNLTQPSTEDIEAVYDSLAATVEDDLKGSRDSTIQVQWDGDLDMSCQTGGACTVTGTVRDASTNATGATRVRMDATFSNAELGEKKCDDIATLEAGKTVELSCSVDYALAPSANPQSYEISGEGLLSTRAMTGDGLDALKTAVEEQREATLAAAEGGSSASPEASPAAGADAGD